jgi:hypothetical protein
MDGSSTHNLDRYIRCTASNFVGAIVSTISENPISLVPSKYRNRRRTSSVPLTTIEISTLALVKGMIVPGIIFVILRLIVILHKAIAISAGNCFFKSSACC